MPILFENQLCEIVETILPDHEVVLFIRVVDEGARDALLVAEGLELCAVVHQTVSATAYHPQEFVLLLHLVDVRNELCSTHCVGGR